MVRARKNVALWKFSLYRVLFLIEMQWSQRIQMGLRKNV